MTTPNLIAGNEELLALAVRCEQATGPDREIDGEIATRSGLYVYEKQGRDRKEWFYPVNGGWRRQIYGVSFERLPDYTASLDAATSLFPADTMYRSGHSALGPDPSLFFCDAVLPSGQSFHAVAATEVGARVAAALRARAQSTGEPV